MEEHIIVRTADLQDVQDIVDLERSCPTAAHWIQWEYLDSLANAGHVSRLVLVAHSTSLDHGKRFGRGATILGFLIGRHLSPEWELENIVVAPEARGKGIGTRLMEELLTRAQLTNSRTVLLEVRESNGAARALYEKLGFHQTGRRKSYYNNPVEDAILYCKKLGEARISS